MHETVIQMLFWDTAQPSSLTSTLLFYYFFYAASAWLGAGWGRSEGKAGFLAWFPEEAGARLSAVRLRVRPHLYSLPGCHHPGRGLLPPAPPRRPPALPSWCRRAPGHGGCTWWRGGASCRRSSRCTSGVTISLGGEPPAAPNKLKIQVR